MFPSQQILPLSVDCLCKEAENESLLGKKERLKVFKDIFSFVNLDNVELSLIK